MDDIISSQDEKNQLLSLRERKKRLVQTTIEETALQLFQQKGYEQTSIQDIADAVMMSTRTFFRYFASKEEVLFGPMHAAMTDAISSLQRVAPTESPQKALRATFLYLAGLYQLRRDSFLIRYQVAAQTPSIASLYLYALLEKEPAICDALCSHLESATNRDEIRFPVAIFMTTFLVAAAEWLKHEAQEDLVVLLGGYLERLSSLSPM
ncbi:hypothetical protein KSF_097060 [Reticulibacter mediterranei]|uniref:HTH tetR-type domain-containing protein n=1 Tax=Reticulibacter mediterranei TaxID=2778369 RepID=A0A8J3IW64_9CHLR|nr:TetR/AcrR family transcriptional regulator [Reticulibacter mediterranei]GHO99658.1 hypothetical protein KSF_097060 [Reticulibacter mediterranei]